MADKIIKRITTLIVDDQPVVRQGVRAFLEAQPDIDVVAEASSGAEAVALAVEYAPDVVLMDLIMPGMDGVEATRRVKEACPQTRIVILTSFHDDEHVLPAVMAGATSYLLKDVSPAELVDAVRKAPCTPVSLRCSCGGCATNAKASGKSSTISAIGSWRCCDCSRRACQIP
jgi:DNA-binding NarL/FixJ family response regulator